MAALSAATAIVAVVVPLAAGLSLLGSVPMGLLAYRYRIRVIVAATAAAAVIAFLVGGSGGLMTVLHCSVRRRFDGGGQAPGARHTDGARHARSEPDSWSASSPWRPWQSCTPCGT